MSGAGRLAEARLYVERALGGIDTLHIGPLDYNACTTVDYLRTAAGLVEQYQRDHKQNNPTPEEGIAILAGKGLAP